MKRKILPLLLLMVFTSFYASAQDVISWDNYAGLSLSDNTFIKEDSDGWDNGYAYSTNAATLNGDFVFEVPLGTAARVGLSSDPANLIFDFGYEITSDEIYIYEANAVVSQVATLTQSAILYVKITDDMIQYFLNEDLLYTSLTSVSTALYPLVTIYTSEGLINDSRFIPAVTWQNTANVDPYSSSYPYDFIKTEIDDWENAYGISETTLSDQKDAIYTVSIEDPNNNIQFGFTTDNNTLYFDYSFRTENSELFIYEQGVQIGHLGNVEADDRLYLRKEMDYIQYWKNGDLLYTSAINAPPNMYLAFAIYSYGGAFRKYKFIETEVNCLTVNAGSTRTICASSSPSTQLNAITPNVSGLAFNCIPVSYSWSPATGLSSSSIKNPVASPTTSTTYTVTVTFPGNITAQSSVYVNVLTVLTPTISISSNAGGTFCQGTNVTFTASITNGGSSPVYQWKVNGVIKSYSNIFQTTTLANNDNVTCALISSVPCPSAYSVTSNTLQMSVTSAPTQATLTLSANKTFPICRNSSVTFTATPANAGVSPSYVWKKDGTIVSGVTGTTYTTSYNANSTIQCLMSTGIACMATEPVTATSFVTVYSVAVNLGSAKKVPVGSLVNLGDNLNLSGGTAPYTYSWYPTAGLSSATIANPSVSPYSTQTYSLSVTDANGCIGGANITVEIDFPSYAELSSKKENKSYEMKEEKLCFRFLEEYRVPGSAVLSYRILDLQNNTYLNTQGLPGLPVKNGNNMLIMDLSSLGLTAGDYYLLEVSNIKREKSYLKFYKK